MAKELVPKKLVIEFIEGNFYDGVLIYKVNENGVVGRFKSIGIKGANFSKPTLNGILQNFIRHAGKSEGIDEQIDLP
ncbi:MAG: hypothetical protein JW847_02350 [Candidatus Omnitrophica bacterium]|nr:hypothetical protein [Candidatus Omnitrophota bacterium]